MKTIHLAGFLLGHRDSITRVTSDRTSIPVGLILVLLAGVARDHDLEDLTGEGIGTVFLGLAISSALWIVLHIGILWTFRGRWIGEDGKPAPAPGPTVLLGAIWATAPLAWLYAVPFERMADPVSADDDNVALLALVATWRVLLMIRVLSVLTATGMAAAAPAILAPVTILVA